MIESIGFGKMTIFGRSYTSDLMILPDGTIIDSWRRIQGHRLVREDITTLLATDPRIVIVGTGIFGRMRTDSQLEAHCAANGIEFIAQHTKKATQTFNHLRSNDQNVAGCFHLTC